MRRAWIALCALGLSACASTGIDRQRSEANDFARTRFDAELRVLDSDAARRDALTEVDRLLQQPVSQQDAVRIALAWSPALQALMADGAQRSAVAAQPARLPNPVFAFEKMVRSEGGMREVEIGRVISFSLLDLLWLPSRLDVARNTQAGLRLNASAEVTRSVAAVRQAWVRAVAAEQALAYHGRVLEAADAGAELARRMQAAGNFSRLQRAREQGFYAEAAANLTRARAQALSAREALVRQLGLDGERAARLRLPERLPDLPATAMAENQALQASLDQRLDVRMARHDLDTTARELGLTRVTSVVDGLHLGLANKSESGKPMQRGFEVELPLPLFDFGDARRADAEARYLAALNRNAQVAVDAGSGVREQYGLYRASLDLARHYRDEIVPLAKTVSDETLLKYNGMLIGVFDLLADARVQAGTVVAAIDAERDFWLAEAALQSALLGQPTSIPALTTTAARAAGAAH
ncbi:MAG: TolC family protein [Moraxellaceae bacterium]|nr:TolC family protein [Moraxellaceae bacterium]